MVDFGLKLEDNKVSDWSEHYIRYDVLNGILTKCEAAMTRYEELAKRQPETAIIITNAYHSEESTSKSSSLDSMEMTSNNTKRSSFFLHSIREENHKTQIETSKFDTHHRLELINGSSPSDYGSCREIETVSCLPNDPTSSAITRALVKAASDVSDFYNGRYETKLYEALKSIDKYETQFGDALVSDIHKVNVFYKYKIMKLENKLSYLRESVQPKKVNQDSATLSNDLTSKQDEDCVTPLIRSDNRKSASSPILLMKKIVSWTSPKSHTPEKDPKQKLTIDPLDPDDITDANDFMSEEITLQNIREVGSVQRALIDYYRTAKLLQNFVIMNYTGFVKLVKRHSKTIFKQKVGKYNDVIRVSNICNEGKDVELIVNRMEKLYAVWFCDKNIAEARAQILIKKGDVLEMDWSQLRLGYRMGMSAILALWICWDCILCLVTTGQSTIGGRTAFPIIRACIGLLQLQWCWGISVFVWTRYRVNYIFIFDFDPILVQTPLAIFNDAVDNTLFLLVCTLLYYKAGTHELPVNVPSGVFPLILLVYTLYQLIFPLRLRIPMWKTIMKVVTTPMSSPSFFQGYVGDIFTSMVKIFQDLVWTLFFVVCGDWRISEDSKDAANHPWAETKWYTQFLIPVVTLLPLWFKFNECLRRYADSGKYHSTTLSLRRCWPSF
jgi:EXS family/SPX domain